MTNNSKIADLLEQAWTERREDKYDLAKTFVDEAHGLCSDQDYNSLGRIYHIYMQFEYDQDNFSKALELCQQSLGYYKKATNSDKIAHSTRHIADLERHLGNNESSELNSRIAIGIYKANPETYKGDLAKALGGFGELLEKRKKIKEAISVWKEAKDLYKACNIKEGVDAINQKLDIWKSYSG